MLIEARLMQRTRYFRSGDCPELWKIVSNSVLVHISKMHIRGLDVTGDKNW